MKLLFELSKIHPTLPQDEIISCFNAEEIPYHELYADDNVLVLDAPLTNLTLQRLAERLSLTYIIDEYLFTSSLEDDAIIRMAQQHPLQTPGTVAIRCKNRSADLPSDHLIDVLGDVYTNGRTVNLSHPQHEIRAVVTDNKVVVGVKKHEINTSSYEQRKAQFRPFFSPISLHPKIARALVNIAEVKKEGVLLDPFCGTGGFLIEAGLLGITIKGSDIEQKMVDGCRTTLEHYHVNNYDLQCCDIGKIPFTPGSIDAIVTDFPYGKSTTTKGEERSQLYERAFKQIARLLKKNGRAVIGFSDRNMIPVGENYLTHTATYHFRVHRSLTRYFVVYRN